MAVGFHDFKHYCMSVDLYLGIVVTLEVVRLQPLLIGGECHGKRPLAPSLGKPEQMNKFIIKLNQSTVCILIRKINQSIINLSSSEVWDDSKFCALATDSFLEGEASANLSELASGSDVGKK